MTWLDIIITFSTSLCVFTANNLGDRLWLWYNVVHVK